jgi:sugar lactone lactonase YvrE
MKAASIIVAVCALVLADLSAAIADDDDAPRFPQNATFTTQAITTLAIEGLTGDAAGNFYTTGRTTPPALCPVWKITGAVSTVVGNLPNPSASPCNPSGITFDRFGNLYISDAASGGVVWTLAPNATMPPTAEPFATGVPGTNGLAFDRDGNLWTGDGTTGQGRVWRIDPTGGTCEPSFTRCKEVFRIQRMANSANVGRQASTLQPPTGTTNPQPLVANGVAFNSHGDLFIADTARGAIWKAEFDHSGKLQSRTNCDTTFPDNTLCLDNIFVAHPYLEGADGIALDRAGNIWVAANERNAIVVVTRKGHVLEIFRTPVNKAGLRNSADATVGNNHILEFPTSPFLSGTRFCTSQSDGDRRDNSPRTAGEINAGNSTPVARGKISCMDQELEIPGLPLPVQ